MNLASITQPAAIYSRQFDVLYTRYNDKTYVAVQAAITGLAADYGVLAHNVKVGPALGETIPPRGHVTGEMVGARGAVEAAIAALGELRLT